MARSCTQHVLPTPLQVDGLHAIATPTAMLSVKSLLASGRRRHRLVVSRGAATPLGFTLACKMSSITILYIIYSYIIRV